MQNFLKQSESLSPLPFHSTVKHVIRKIQENNWGLNLNGIHQLLVCTDNVNLLGESKNAVKNQRLYYFEVILTVHRR
jgi:hypothetical protein